MLPLLGCDTFNLLRQDVLRIVDGRGVPTQRELGALVRWMKSVAARVLDEVRLGRTLCSRCHAVLRMFSPHDFILCLKDAGEDQPVLTRLALNILYDPVAHPVDLSEVMRLHGRNWALARTFIESCAADPASYTSMPDELVRDLRRDVANWRGEHADRP